MGSTASRCTVAAICAALLASVGAAQASASTPVKTVLVAHPYTLKLLPGAFSFPYYLAPLYPSELILTPSATLRPEFSYQRLPGKAITFTAAGQTICTATTDEDGLAKCDGMFAGLVQVLLGLGYQASFAGDDAYQASTAQGPIVT